MATIGAVIVSHNYDRYLNQAIRSVREQSRQFDKVIVVADCCEDRTADVAKDCGVDCLTTWVGKPSGARNAGILAIGTDYFVPIDADDYLLPDFLASLSHKIDEGAEVIYSDYKIDPWEKEVKSKPLLNIHSLLDENFIPITSLVSSDLFRKVLGYGTDDELVGYEDWDFWLKCRKAAARFAYIPKTLFVHRIHDDSLSTKHKERLKDVRASLSNKYL